MKKIKSISICIVALFVLSSCTINSSESDTQNSSSTNGIDSIVVEEYNESTVGTTAIMVDGVLYRNKFQGDLILRNPKYGAEPVLSDSTGQYYHLEGIDHDLIYNASGKNKGTSENIYCRDTQWSELNSYYSTSTNFIYRCIVKSNGKSAETIDVEAMDIIKLNKLVEFCESAAFVDSEQIKSVPTESLGDKIYRFGMSSKDGLFSSNAREFCVFEGSLVYKYREIRLEEKTLIVDIPEELSNYFILIINDLNN